MAAVDASASWIPEDDLLLKNAIEAGASLEALAKGAVQFSRKFTFNELQDRWYSLLYDPDVSALASARMGELQGSVSNLSSELNRSDKTRQSKTVHEKRKVGSICKHYYAMRKRIRNDFFSSADLPFLAEPNLHNCRGNDGDFHEHVPLGNGPPVGNCLPNHFGIQETNFDILHHAFPQTMMGIVATNDEATNIGDAFHSEGPNSLADNHIGRVARKDCLHQIPKAVSSSFQYSLRNDGGGSFQQSSSHEDVPHSLENNLVDLGKCSAVEEMGLSQPLTDTKLFETDDSDAKPLSTFDSTNNNLQSACSELGGTQHLNSPNSDGSTSFHTMGFSPVLPNMPLWKAMEDISAPAMTVTVSPSNKIQVGENILALPDNDDSKHESSSGRDIIHSGQLLEDRRNSDGFVNPTAMSDGEFVDLSESLLDFSNDDGILFMDVDGKDTTDKPCHDSSLPLSTPMDANEVDAPKNEHKNMIVSITGPSTASCAYPAESEIITSQLHCVHGDQRSVSQSGINMPTPSLLISKPLELNTGNTYCTLNTEDQEIPCNDDIFLLIHPAASLAFSVTIPIAIDAIDPSSSGNEKDTGHGLNFLKKREDHAQLFMPSQMVGKYMLPATGPKQALAGCTVKTELPDTICMALAPTHANKAIGDSQCKSVHTTPNVGAGRKLENDVTKVEFGVVGTPATLGEMTLHAEAGSLEITLPESVVNPSVSDDEEPESDNDVPHFSDIEAMVNLWSVV
ncbi:hypothetical protein U1Q18_011592 [Sarracenia purpurea var. burkii]